MSHAQSFFGDVLDGIASQQEALRCAQYVSNLRSHDWGHEFSDDARVVAKGRAELAWLRDEQRDRPGVRAVEPQRPGALRQRRGLRVAP